MGSRTKNILRNIGFMLSMPVIIGAFVFAVTISKDDTVCGIEVEILNPELQFVTKEDITKTVLQSNIVLGQSDIYKTNINQLEEDINANPWILQAEVYLTANKNIRVKIKQYEPLLRVQRTDSTANGYFLDKRGFMIPLSRKFYPDLPILTTQRRITSIQQRKELVALAQYIEQDTFWRATISQINLDTNNDIELISLIGNANVRFGTTENMEDKFFRLFHFYKKGINRINWENVKELDVRFAKQLVCRRYHKEHQLEETQVPTLYAKAKTIPASNSNISQLAKLNVPTNRTAKSNNSKPATYSDAVSASTTLQDREDEPVVKESKSKETSENEQSTKEVVNRTASGTEQNLKKSIPKTSKKENNDIIIDTEPQTLK